MPKNFIVEKINVFSKNSYRFLRLLYGPLIKNESITLFCALDDVHSMQKENHFFEEFSFLQRITGMSMTEIANCLKRLEAVGLIRTYNSSDEQRQIITLCEPLAPEMFRRNKLLYNEYIKKVDDITFEKIEFSFAEKRFDKAEFHEVTTKFQDIFSINLINHSEENTLELSVKNLPKTKEQAIISLPPTQFISFLTSSRISPSLLATVQRVIQLGFSSKTINTIIDYVFAKNGKIVAAHLETIAKDLKDKNIINSDEVLLELTEALNANNKRQIANNQISSNVENIDTD